MLAELVLGIPKDAVPVILMVIIALLVRNNVRGACKSCLNGHCVNVELMQL